MLAAAPVETKEEEFEEQPRERSNTMPSLDVEESSDGVVLRVPSGPRQNPDKRKSGKNTVNKTDNFSLFYVTVFLRCPQLPRKLLISRS